MSQPHHGNKKYHLPNSYALLSFLAASLSSSVIVLAATLEVLLETMVELESVEVFELKAAAFDLVLLTKLWYLDDFGLVTFLSEEVSSPLSAD